MATQTRSNSFRARTRLKSARSGASFLVLLWSRSTVRSLSEPSNFARNSSWQLRHAAIRSEQEPARNLLCRAPPFGLFSGLPAPPETARICSTLLGTAHGNSHSSKPFCGLLETLFGLLTQNIGPDSSKPFCSLPGQLRSRLGTAKHCSGPLRTAQNPLEATSGRLRDHFGAASGPPSRP